jgi:hypothetical protein
MAALSASVLVALYAFLWVRSRKNPLFLAGAAAFLGLGRSMYINIVPDQILRQVAFVSVTTGDVLFAAVVLGWVYARGRRPALRVHLSHRWMVIGVCVAYFLALELALSYENVAGLHPTLIVSARDWFYIPFGFLLTLDVLRRFTPHEVVQFVSVLSLATTLLMLLYIASAIGIPVFPYPKYLTTSFLGTTIIRDSSTFPYWIALAWGYYLTLPKKNAWVFAALGILAAGTLLSYTRSWVLGLAAIVVLAVILQFLQQERRVRALALLAAAVTLLAIFLAGGPALVPAQFDYLSSRFGLINSPARALSDHNAQLRLELFRQAQKAGAQVDSLFGAGLSDSATPAYSRGNSYDSDWIRIVWRTGWAGVSVLAMPFLLAISWGMRGFLRERGSTESGMLLLAGTLATIFSFAHSFTFLTYFWWPALSLFPVALIAYASGVPAGLPARGSGASVPHFEVHKHKPTGDRGRLVTMNHDSAT